jgi:multidrug efflux pump subunit AcrB
MPLHCSRCQARLDLSPDPPGRRVTCPSCQAVFTAGEEPTDTPRVAPAEETGITSGRGIRVQPAGPPRPGAAGRTGRQLGHDPQKAGAVPWYLVGIALLPLLIPAVAIPLHLLVGGLAGGALWGAVGGGLAGACLAVARRRAWTRRARVSGALGLAGLGFAILLGTLAADFFSGPEAARPLPSITVEASYPGATAQVVADTVAAPIEQQVNGVEGMVGMRSQCNNDGSYTFTVTFKRGTDLDIARVLVANREALAEPGLPDLVKRRGLTVKTASPGALMILNLFSPDSSRDTLYLSNYATLQLRDELMRLPGVGDVTFVGQRDYGVRVWLDLEKLTAHDLTAADVVRAIEQQNVPVAPGQAPEGPMALNALGRLADAEPFENIILKATPEGRTIRLKDVARFVMGAGSPEGDVLLDGKPAVALVVHPTPQARPRELSASLREELERQRARLPAGIEIDAAFDFTANLAAASWQATPGYVLLDVDLPPGASPERRLEVLERCAAVVRQVQGVQGVLVMTEHPFDRQRERACALVRLGPADGKSADRDALLRTIRTQLGAVEEAKVRLRDLSGPGRCWGCRYPVELAVSGPEADRVRELAEKLAGRLRQEQGLTDLWAGSDIPPHRELTVTIDAAALRARGVARAEVANTLQVHLGELNVGDFNRFGRTWQVTVKADPGAGNQAEELKKLRVRDADGRLVLLSDLVAVGEVEVSAAVERLNGFPMMSITANPARGVSLAQARALCEARAEEVRRELGLSAEYRLAWR